MDKMKHSDIKYVRSEREACLLVNRPEFRKMNLLDEEEQLFEMELTKPSITLNIPIQIAFFVLQVRCFTRNIREI